MLVLILALSSLIFSIVLVLYESISGYLRVRLRLPITCSASSSALIFSTDLSLCLLLRRLAPSVDEDWTVAAAGL